MANLQATIKVFGKVQGVCYRAEAQKKAVELGLSGWARNERDDEVNEHGLIQDHGAVSLCAQGPIHKLQDFIEWCNTGPQNATVEEMEVKFEEIKEGAELKGFNIA